jgi:signal transduction histidine kinase
VLEDYELMIGQKQARVVVSQLLPVRGVPLQLQQLFSNLLSNSLKFCEQDPVIEIKSEKIEKDEGRLRGLMIATITLK